MDKKLEIRNKIIELNKKYSNDFDLGGKFREYVYSIDNKAWISFCNRLPNDFKLGERIRIFIFNI